MQFDERKQKILAAIVETYIKTGEPVASKTLAQLLDFSVSPATIRNEMAALFEMGYLEQPYTSAGRIPSHLGYRAYIDKLMNCKPLTEQERSEIDALFNVKDPDPDKLLEDAADALAEYTNCATVTATTTPKHVTVKRIDIIPADARTVVLVMIASNGVVKSRVCRVDFRANPDILSFFSKFANDRFAGRSLKDISSWYINSVAVTLGEYSRVFTPLLVGIYELCREVYDGLFYVGGESNLLAYQEFSQIAHDLLVFFSHRDRMMELLNQKDSDVDVRVGKENSDSELTGSSVVVAKYNIGEDRCGAIGVIGPVRLDYQRLIPHLAYFAKTLGKLLSDTLEND